jgi:hypothetical protein
MGDAGRVEAEDEGQNWTHPRLKAAVVFHVVRPGWHELKVGLKDQRGKVTARSGYFVRAAK